MQTDNFFSCFLSFCPLFISPCESLLYFFQIVFFLLRFCCTALLCNFTKQIKVTKFVLFFPFREFLCTYQFILFLYCYRCLRCFRDWSGTMRRGSTERNEVKGGWGTERDASDMSDMKVEGKSSRNSQNWSADRSVWGQK